jgi:hypothetical protein
MTTIHRLELARHRNARPVDLLDSATVHDKEAEAMTITAVDVTAELSRVDAARACAISVDTIKRRQKAGSFPNARQVGLDRSWVIPVRDLVDAGLLPAAALALPAQPGRLDAPAVRATTPAASAHMAEALAEIRGLRAELARAQDEIAFLRQLVAVGRAA